MQTSGSFTSNTIHEKALLHGENQTHHQLSLELTQVQTQL